MRRALVIALVLSLAGVGGYVAWPTERVHASQRTLTALGAPIGGDASPERAAERIADAYLAEHVTIGAFDRHLRLTREELGARVDIDRLAQLVTHARDPESALRRHFDAHFPPDAPLDLPLPIELDAETARRRLVALKDDVDRRAEEARFDTTTRTPRPEVIGRELDVWDTIDRIDVALAAGTAQIAAAVREIPPHRTVRELAGIDTRATLAAFETNYDASERGVDRTFNLRVAASRIDGIVLLPGETLDFNALVGPRDEANGFRVAPVIASGELVDGIGGGTCQISGTLHAAAFFAGLTVIERHPHSRPSSYIKLGLDAAVAYPRINLQLRNPFDFPVVLAMRVDGGIVRAEVHGRAARQLVTFVRRIEDVAAFDERVVTDAALPAGTRVITQRGIPGFEVTSFRILRDPLRGHAIRERIESEYPPTPQIVRVGAGGPAPPGYVAPTGDQHREYVADAYLTMTHDPATGQIEESRRAGRTGVYGWTTGLLSSAR